MDASKIKPGGCYIPIGAVYPDSVMREWSYTVLSVTRKTVQYEVYRPGHDVKVLTCPKGEFAVRMRPALIEKTAR